MLYNEIIPVCFQIHTKHINALFGQNVELLNVELVAHRVTTVLDRVKVTHGNLISSGPIYKFSISLSLTTTVYTKYIDAFGQCKNWLRV
jgi:hypothetical protein